MYPIWHWIKLSFQRRKTQLRSCIAYSFFSLIFVSTFPAHAMERDVPRTIIAIYDSRIESQPMFTLVHRFTEMPLNHLGLKLEYHDVRATLPDLSNRPDVLGIISWFPAGTVLAEDISSDFYRWAIKALDQGKKYALLGSPGVLSGLPDGNESRKQIEEFFKRLGMHSHNRWTEITYNSQIIYKDPLMVEYEHPLHSLFPPYEQIVAEDKSAVSYLKVRNRKETNREADLVVVSPHGGYVAAGFAFYNQIDERGENNFQWYLNPFRFFSEVFHTDDIPKPDTTTLSGRRIFYSHIDGDGWNGLTEIEKYKKPNWAALVSEVIYEEILKGYPDIPVTVGIVAADIDKACFGNDRSIEIARKVLALPNVEPGSHTYTHPFDWNFFADYTPEKEAPFLANYPSPPQKMGDGATPAIVHDHPHLDAALHRLKRTILKDPNKATISQESKDYLQAGYERPRAYACQNFSVNLEVDQSVKKINELLPEGKAVSVIQWSGNTSPFEAAVEESRNAGLRNINGGDTRFDREYPSYAWVAPIGKPVGNQQQIYASSSNENTYTEMWTDRFYGFRYLKRTLENTETPIRIKPFNIYYHTYTGAKLASLNALKENIEYARSSDLCPIWASEYAGIADGFYTTKIETLGNKKWKILNRGALETIRFDNATFDVVDYQHSSGVIGHRHYQGSLYVALDAQENEPVIALTSNLRYDNQSIASTPYLIESQWPVSSVKKNKKSFSFSASGFGNGMMRWWVPKPGKYSIELRKGEENIETLQVETNDEHVLEWSFGITASGQNFSITVMSLS